MPGQQIRNIAIIAHVDHGKTTLVDQLLRQSGQFRQGELKGECILDSNPLERERGITILAKNCAIRYTDRNGDEYHINIVDTPGHADFSGEVERVLKMADGVLLLVDAAEGVMPQTRYVLSKALGNGLRPIVVINKIDRPDARPQVIHNQVFDLLIELDAEHHAEDFPVIYASGRNGWAVDDLAKVPPDNKGDIHVLFDAIIKHIPVPNFDANAPLQVLITTLDYSDYVGRIGIGRVFAGTLRSGKPIVTIDRHGNQFPQKFSQLFRFDGLGRQEVDHVDVGDICAVVGLERVEIGDTLADPENPKALPPVNVDEPTLHMIFRINDGPFAGRDGKYVTSRHLRERLEKELQSNVALQVSGGEGAEEFDVAGRGLMHLGILLENMRREGYELTVGKPMVIYHKEGGKLLEPYELLVLDVPTDYLGSAMQLMGDRRGEMVKMETVGPRTIMQFSIPARGLIGLRGRMLTATKGEAIMHHRYEKYAQAREQIPGRANGVMIATDTGQVTPYAIDQLADRGVMFVEPGEQVYGGQIVGEHCKDNDITINIVKMKRLTNVRSSTKEATVVLKAPRRMTLEAALEYIEDDELVELTPESIRLRKRHLTDNARRRAARFSPDRNQAARQND
ncbi:MAG: translational GTPase TypA [Planctomycetes bacterium]|nr:translational GTPase TypA [Planctomycetota bacterium]